MSHALVTVSGSAFFQPILDLCERMLPHRFSPVIAGRRRARENDYALSIVLLSVVMLESFIGRVSFLQEQHGPKGKPRGRRTSIPEYIASLRRSFPLQKSLTEVFVLRDAIAHGHVWTLKVSDHAKHGQVLHSAALGAGFGSNTHTERVNPTTRRTRALGLHVVPTAIGTEEVIKVLSTIQKVLQFLVRRKLLEPNVIAYRGRFRGRPFDFWQVIAELRSAA